MSSDDDCPWESDESNVPGKMPKIFSLNDGEYSDLTKMRSELIKFSTKVVKVVNKVGWDAIAVRKAVGILMSSKGVCSQA
jgi:hypothetical protein